MVAQKKGVKNSLVQRTIAMFISLKLQPRTTIVDAPLLDPTYPKHKPHLIIILGGV